MTRYLGTLTLGLLLWPGFAAADDEPQPEQPAVVAPPAETPAEEGPDAIFGRLDANGDGQIAEDEVPEDQARFFRRLRRTSDANGDGQLSREEFVAGLTEREPPPAQPAAEQPGRNFDPAALFARFDRNGDDKLKLEEVPEERRGFFEPLIQRADRDGDGALSLEEFTRAMPRQQPGQPGQTPPQSAAAPSAGGERLFVAIDLNGDGTLSAEEIAAAAESLKKLDANGDGAISREELRPAVAERPRAPRTAAATIQQADRDGDAKLSKVEAPAPLMENFERVDANGDGFVDEAELAEGMESLAGAVQGQGLLRRFAESDRNGDGKLSRDEAPEQLLQGFDRIDADDDGAIDRREVLAFLSSAGGVPNRQALRRAIRQSDQDGDGKLSREEAPERIRNIFERVDANGDGFLDDAEARQQPRAEPEPAPPSPEQPDARQPAQPGESAAGDAR